MKILKTKRTVENLDKQRFLGNPENTKSLKHERSLKILKSQDPPPKKMLVDE